MVGPPRLRDNGKAAPIERLGLGEATLGAVAGGQRRDGRHELRVVLAMLLAGQLDVSLRDRDGVRVFALAEQTADLGAQPGKVILPLRLHDTR
jgi:hypothetical protein